MTEQKAIEWDGNHLLVSRGGPMTYRVADTADLCAALDQNAAAREHVIFYFYPNGPVSDLRAECSRLRTELGELVAAMHWRQANGYRTELCDRTPQQFVENTKRLGWTPEAKP